MLGCTGTQRQVRPTCEARLPRFEARAPSAFAQQLSNWPSLWNQSLAFGAGDRPSELSMLLVVPDTIMKRLAEDSVTGMWSIAYVVANENVSGLTVAANAAQLYAELRGSARPMLVMLHDFRPSPHRLAIGLSAIRTSLDSMDRLAVRSIACELEHQDTLPAPGSRDWEWFPASQWAGGLDEVRAEVRRLLPE